MRTLNHFRLFSAIFALGAANVAWAGDDVPPPYPSISPASGNVPVLVPVVPQLPTTPVAPPVVLPPPIVTPSTPILPMLPSVSPNSSSAIPMLPATNPSELPKMVAPVPPPPIVTPTVKTEPVKPSTVSIKIGSTPGLQDHVSKFQSTLNESRLAYDKLMDYSCHFIKQEKIDGKLTGELIYELHARTKPMSVYLKHVEPKSIAGTEICFVSGKYATNQVRMKPAGGTFMTVPLDDARANIGRHHVDQIGIGSIIDRLDKTIATEAKVGNPVGVTIADFVYAGRRVTRYELTCERSHAFRASYRTVVFIDKETKLPIRFESYDEPKKGIDSMLECVSFVNLKLNIGHSAVLFDR